MKPSHRTIFRRKFLSSRFKAIARWIERRVPFEFENYKASNVILTRDDKIIARRVGELIFHSKDKSLTYLIDKMYSNAFMYYVKDASLPDGDLIAIMTNKFEELLYPLTIPTSIDILTNCSQTFIRHSAAMSLMEDLPQSEILRKWSEAFDGFPGTRSIMRFRHRMRPYSWCFRFSNIKDRITTKDVQDVSLDADILLNHVLCRDKDDESKMIMMLRFGGRGSFVPIEHQLS